MIKIYMTGYNSEYLINDAIKSILGQSFTDWELQVVIDPKEGSKTGEFAKLYECSKIKVHLNKERKGLMHNVLLAVDMMKPDNDDIIVCVDSDDMLAGPQVLQKVYDAYTKDKKMLVSYGGISVMEGNELKRVPFFRKYAKQELEKVRTTAWHGTHLRTMKYKVWKNIPESYTRDKKGNYYTCANDVALMKSAIELAGPDRIGYFDFPTYIYRPPETSKHMYYANVNSGETTHSDIDSKDAIAMHDDIKSRRPLQPMTNFNTLTFAIYIYGDNLKDAMIKAMQTVDRYKTDDVKEFILVELYDEHRYYNKVAKDFGYKYVSYDISNKRNPNISSLGRNLAVLSAKEDFVIVNDADLLINKLFFKNIQAMSTEHLYFGSWSEIKYQKESGKGYDKTTEWQTGKFTYANGGSVSFNRNFFIELGGYDNIFQGWGAEDNDFNFRASVAMGYPAPCVQGNKLIHVWHPSNALSLEDDIRVSNNNILYFRMKEYGDLINRKK